MSIEDYNRHAHFGPAAGPPTNLSEAMGQAAFIQTAERNRNAAQMEGVYATRAETKAPHWMMHHAFKRGVFFVVGGAMANLGLAALFGPRPPDVIAFFGDVISLISLAGFPLMLFGILNFFTRRRRRAQQEALGLPTDTDTDTTTDSR